MPELPEVVTIKKDLEKNILNKKIVEIKINRPEVIKEPSLPVFKKEIIGERIKKIIRRGKLLILELKRNKFLIIHLRVNGWVKYGQQAEGARIVFKFSNQQCLSYVDSRLLGHLQLRSDYKDLNFIKKLGPEIFDLTASQFKEMVKKRKGNIKSLIMNQNFLAGLGNIYAQEALFLAEIDPRRQAFSLSDKEIELLYQKIKAVLKEAIKYRGSSVDVYRDPEGKKGKMEARLKVYKKDKKNCLRCGNKLARVKISGRGTCFCPGCQR